MTEMALENIVTDIKNNVLVITINRPDKLNALNKNTIAEIGKAVNAAETDASIKGIIITGSGSNPGEVQSVYLRGGSTANTLILIDGISVNDASGISGEFSPSYK